MDLKAMQIPTIVMSGPSGVGKGAIRRALALFEKLSLVNFHLVPVVLYTTRNPRNKDEKDGVSYWFANEPTSHDAPDYKIREEHKAYLRQLKAAETIGASPDNFATREGLVVCEVGSDWQAIWLSDIANACQNPNEVIFIEMYYAFREALLNALAQHKNDSWLGFLFLFIRPLSANEMLRRAKQLKIKCEDVITREMRKRIEERIEVGWSRETKEEIDKRVSTAYTQLLAGQNYDVAIVNPCGEGDPCWGSPNEMPTGPALKTVRTICRIISAHLYNYRER